VAHVVPDPGVNQRMMISASTDSNNSFEVSLRG